ncbi:hypothetical protein PRUPE_6G101800 [Prunus persica]|uniref:Uncharacterized protein n=1 Tax=Prunus persica TaxID=3760 RepID=A0A251NQR6_PRUPE|nr:hypothetical protein PRUPE_6G101800 [Prunus persica]
MKPSHSFTLRIVATKACHLLLGFVHSLMDSARHKLLFFLPFTMLLFGHSMINKLKLEKGSCNSVIYLAFWILRAFIITYVPQKCRDGLISSSFLMCFFLPVCSFCSVRICS